MRFGQVAAEIVTVEGVEYAAQAFYGDVVVHVYALLKDGNFTAIIRYGCAWRFV